MLRSAIKMISFYKILFNLILIPIFFVSCDFIDLRQINYSVDPDNFDKVLNNYDSPLIIKFDTEMEKKEAEGAVQVYSDFGAVKGDFNWRGNDLYFTPVPNWTPGIKYALTINGTIKSKDGRELRLQHYVSFYAVSNNPPPFLESHYPADGEAIGINNFSLVLRFSNPMDRLSAESAVSIDGIGNKTFEWSNEDKTLAIIADKPLSAWTSFRWNLKDTAKNTAGIPLPKQYSGSFTTDLDQTLPEIVKIYPVTFAYGKWSATGADIETGLALGDGVAVEFNKPMGENALRSIRFEPSATGRAEMLSLNTVVYIFSRNLEPETEYTLIVSSDAKDTEGLKTGAEYRLSFLPDIPYLKLLSFNSEDVSSGDLIPIKINEGFETAEFSLRFSMPLNAEEKRTITQRIMLSAFFPKTLAPVALQHVNWFADDRVIMRWEGFEASCEKQINYYKLTIPGGRGGIYADGFYMKEDAVIYLEASNEN